MKNKRSHTFWGMLLIVAAAFGLIWLKHGDWLRAPNEIMLGQSPDGFKNYMTTAWHVRHDSTFVHYGGMNYPYGEHSLFTDNQPIFSTALSWWNRSISPIADQTVGLMNIFQVISMLAGFALLFLLLRKLHLPVWYAGLVTLGMNFLSPQYIRFDGHFGLSHTFVIPGILYLLCLYEERHSRRYQSLLIGLLVWFSAQLHFYYFGLAALFLSLYVAHAVLTDFTWKNIRARASHWVVMVLLPFAALNLWIHWADFVPDRPASPWGFTTYIGYWEGVFLPYENFPMHQWISKNILPIRTVDGEARAYVGAVAFFFTLGLLGRGIYRRVLRIFSKRKSEAEAMAASTENAQHRTFFALFPPEWDTMAHHRVQKNYLRGVFAAAFVLLLFSCGFPFAIPAFEWMVDFFGPLRQFRGLGRFTWAYFYVINVLAFYMAWHHAQFFPAQWRRWFFYVSSVLFFYLLWSYGHHGPRRWEQGVFFVLEASAFNFGLWWLSRRFNWFDGWDLSRSPIFKNALALAPVLVLCWESYFFQKNKPLDTGANQTQPAIFAQKHENNWLEKVDFSKYQALLPLPYYHMGSENLWIDIQFPIFIRTQLTAYHTGVPDMGVNMSRTSIGQTMKSVGLTLEPCEQAPILADLPDARPIALMVMPERWDEVQRKYRHLLAKARPMFDCGEIRVLELPIDSLRAAVREHIAGVERDMASRTLYPIGKWLSTSQKPDFQYVSFDSLSSSAYAFQGKGAFAGNMGDTTWICDKALPKGMYTLSFWTKANLDMGMNHEMKVFEHSLADGHEIHLYHEGMRFYIKSIKGDWAFFEFAFEVRADNSRTRIFLRKPGANNPFFLDELLLKPMNTEVFRREPGHVVRNNFWYEIR